eukprot:6202054-Pleurochrysis_carterae.AAC.2
MTRVNSSCTCKCELQATVSAQKLCCARRLPTVQKSSMASGEAQLRLQSQARRLWKDVYLTRSYWQYFGPLSWHANTCAQYGRATRVDTGEHAL